MNINENMRNKRNIGVKSRGLPRKLLIFQLVIALENQTWYQTDAKIQTFYLLIIYVNYLIIIFMNINENNRNERKSWKTLMRVYVQNYSYLNSHISKTSKLCTLSKSM